MGQGWRLSKAGGGADPLRAGQTNPRARACVRVCVRSSIVRYVDAMQALELSHLGSRLLLFGCACVRVGVLKTSYVSFSVVVSAVFFSVLAVCLSFRGGLFPCGAPALVVALVCCQLFCFFCRETCR